MLIAVVAICQAVGFGQAPAASALAEAQMQIETASRVLVEAQLHYDAPAVARLLTKDFVYVGNDGSLARKE